MRWNAIVLFLLAICSCSYIESLKEDSEMITKHYDIGFFNEIETVFPYKIILIKAGEPKLVFTGKSYLMNGIRINQSDQHLILDHSHKTFISRKNMLTVYVHSPNFRKIELNAPSMILTEETLEVEKLEIEISSDGSFSEVDLNLLCDSLSFTNYGNYNSGEQYLSGEAGVAVYHIEGCVNLYANTLKSNKVNIAHYSIGKCVVWAIENLDVNIWSSGNTYYLGTPLIKSEQTNSMLFDPSGGVFPLDSADISW